MQRKCLLMLLICCLVVFMLSACGGSDTSSSGTSPTVTGTLKQEVTINVQDDYFDPKEVKVPADVPVKVTFVNKGKKVHIVEIKGLTSETPLQPGESKLFTLTAKAQSYKIYDEQHESQGMVGSYQGVKQ